MSALSRRGVIAAALGAGFACAAPGSMARASEGFAPPAATLARPVAAGRSALPLKIRDASGAAVSLGDYGARLTVLALWAPWCLPCRRELPTLAALDARLSRLGAARVVALGFDWRGSRALQRYFDEAGITRFAPLLGDGEDLQAVLGIEALPSTLVLNGAGTVIAQVEAEARWDDDATLAWLLDLM